ncbi:hypothetical protein Slin15195_G061070 [Septoria linicola]|uniref:Uncharacterized protein n=1 Tax=Septoria linicola TaxID=215465 RepID=A0A9Q9EKW5_9PEZI|nr:hypothetical protein Slin14017_G076880 [Septoria linicola]USW52788.1 hypothetical protein Slin15195_G061070 [Septoria linicola]
MNGQGRQQYPAPSFPPPPTEEQPRGHHPNMTTGLPNYAYRAMYDNQYTNQTLPPPPPKAGSHSHDSNRSQRSAHGSTRGRPEEERFGRRHLEDGQYESERRTRTNDRRRSRRPTSSYDSESYDSRDTRHRRSDRRRGEPRSRSRRRSLERDKRNQEVQKQQQQQKQQQPAEEKKTGFAKIEDYITPFNVGILMGCMDLIGGSISLYMTNKRFSKKALAKGPAPGEPGASSGGGESGGQDGGADKKQARSHSRVEGRPHHRSSSRTGSQRNRKREGKLHDERDPYSRRDDSEEDSDSTGSSYWSRSDRRYRHMPERLEYDDRGRPLSGTARAAMRGAARR